MRNFETGTFFKTATTWTNDPMDALSFPSTGSAIEAARGMSFKNLEIVKLNDDGTQVLGPKIKSEDKT